MLDAMPLQLFGTVLAGFFAIMNPLANTPIFLGLTDGMAHSARRAVAAKASLVAFVVVAAFALLGQVIFSVFGITTGAFRVAGGIIVFLIGYHMLHGEHSSLHHTKRAKRAAEAHHKKNMLRQATPESGDATPAGAKTESASLDQEPEAQSILSVAVSPLGVPLLAGPGTIATAVGFSAGGWLQVGVTITAFATLCIGTWVSFVTGEKLVRALGPSVLTVITRLMGLILAVIGVQMLLHGLRESGF